jgi:hypothetical protein
VRVSGAKSEAKNVILQSSHGARLKNWQNSGALAQKSTTKAKRTKIWAKFGSAGSKIELRSAKTKHRGKFRSSKSKNW